MSRWIMERGRNTIERSGTGVEKSGTGIERSGTGIEKSGTGIEKSGTGVGKSGTGVRGLLVSAMFLFLSFASSAHSEIVGPEGTVQLVVDDDTVAVSWIFESSVFSGVTRIRGSIAAVQLTEVSMSETDLAYGATGGSVLVTGGGTGSSTKVTGGGTGSSTLVTGGGTGGSTLVTGGGTGLSIQVTGGGTGNSTAVTGGGTGDTLRFAENGAESLLISPPQDTGLTMEVFLRCGSASVSILDTTNAPLATFSNVPVIGDTGLCYSASDIGADFARNPGGDFRIQ